MTQARVARGVREKVRVLVFFILLYGLVKFKNFWFCLVPCTYFV